MTRSSTGIALGTARGATRRALGTARGATRRGTGTTRRHTALATVALALSATAVLTACSAFGLGPGAGLRGDWGLVTGEDAAGAFDLSVGGVTMIVDGDAISGVAACNTYGGTVIGSVADVEQPLRVEQMFQTEMACVDDGVMQLEQRYLDALAAVTSARRVDADTVRLSGPNVVLEFDLLVEG